MVQYITATRAGKTRKFPLQVWNNLPKGRYGWQEAAQAPDELKDTAPALKEAGKTEPNADTNPEFKYVGWDKEALRAEITKRGLEYAPALKEAGLTNILVESDKAGYVPNQA